MWSSQFLQTNLNSSMKSSWAYLKITHGLHVTCLEYFLILFSPKSTNKSIDILFIHYTLNSSHSSSSLPPKLQLHFDHHRRREVKEEKGRARNTKDRKKHASIILCWCKDTCCKCIHIQTYNQCQNKQIQWTLSLDQIHQG